MASSISNSLKEVIIDVKCRVRDSGIHTVDVTLFSQLDSVSVGLDTVSIKFPYSR